jgi:hypothetical protein
LHPFAQFARIFVKKSSVIIFLFYFMKKNAKTAVWIIILIVALGLIWRYLGGQSSSTVIPSGSDTNQTNTADNGTGEQAGTSTQSASSSVPVTTGNSGAQTGDSAVPTSDLDSDASLGALTTSAGPVSPAFDPSILNYSLEMPAGSQSIPTVSAIVNDTGKATYTVTQAETLPGTAVVKVTAQDGVTTQTYTVNFTSAVSGQ